MAGILYGVGIGPGDPELLTLKAVKIIQECDVIGVPAKDEDSCTAYQIALQAVPDMKEKPVVAVPIPMTTNQEKLKQVYETGCRKLIEQLDQNKKIAFLNLGDPTIYGTYMKIHEVILNRGYQVKLISGVPSFCAVAAALNLELGSGRENIHILPGCYCGEEIEAYAGTKILMKSAGKMNDVKQKLVKMQDEGRGTAFAVTNCGMENQKIYSDIRMLDENAGYFTTIVVKEKE